MLVVSVAVVEPSATWFNEQVRAASSAVAHDSSLVTAASVPSQRHVVQLLQQGNASLTGAGNITGVVYRMLGNDSPPLQSRGQTRQNLAYVLAHEGPPPPSFRRCWVLNRIFDPEVRGRMCVCVCRFFKFGGGAKIGANIARELILG